jgi:hypothetical protein
MSSDELDHYRREVERQRRLENVTSNKDGNLSNAPPSMGGKKMNVVKKKGIVAN